MKVQDLGCGAFGWDPMLEVGSAGYIRLHKRCLVKVESAVLKVCNPLKGPVSARFLVGPLEACCGTSRP